MPRLAAKVRVFTPLNYVGLQPPAGRCGSRPARPTSGRSRGCDSSRTGSPQTLEGEADAELQLPRRGHGNNLAENTPTPIVKVQVLEFGVVERVEELEAELQVGAFLGDKRDSAEVLQYAAVEVVEPGAADAAFGRGAEGQRRRGAEGAGAEPIVERVRIGDVAAQVRPIGRVTAHAEILRVVRRRNGEAGFRRNHAGDLPAAQQALGDLARSEEHTSELQSLR